MPYEQVNGRHKCTLNEFVLLIYTILKLVKKNISVGISYSISSYIG